MNISFLDLIIVVFGTPLAFFILLLGIDAIVIFALTLHTLITVPLSLVIEAAIKQSKESE